MFVLTMLKGKTDGRYFEIGAADPFKGSNTALLEKLGWTGQSVEILEHEVEKFRKLRKNPIIHADATQLDYSEILSGHYDYLQVDCEPPTISLKILKMLPWDTCTFGVTTFEHDHYADVSRKIRKESRDFLSSKGYVLVAPNIAPDNKSAYEDWWVHPDHVDLEILERMKIESENALNAEKYMLFL